MKYLETKHINLAVLFFLLCSFMRGYSNNAYTFVENGGRFPSSVKYVLKVQGGYVFFEDNRVLFNFLKPESVSREFHKSLPVGHKISGHSYAINFLEIERSETSIYGLKERDYTINYLKGSKRATKLKSYEEVFYKNVYPGISLRFYLSGENLKYDIIVEKNADLNNLKFEYEGLSNMAVRQGVLYLETSIDTLREEIPYAYNLNDSKNHFNCDYLLKDNVVTYLLPLSNITETVVIDPILIFSTFSGSTADNWGNTATFDERGRLYSGGISIIENEGESYPTTIGAYQTSNSGDYDVAITKYDSTGWPVYSTYLGGENAEIPQSMVVNSRGELIIMGVTSSANFPVSSDAFDQFFNGGDFASPLGVDLVNGTDIFVTILGSEGDSIVGSTYIGGSMNDGYMSVEMELTKNYGDESRGDVYVDGEDNIYVASKTLSTDFPLIKGIQSQHNEDFLDAIIMKFNPNLETLIWSTFLGGEGFDAAYSIKKNSLDQVVVSGGTTSSSIHEKFINEYSGGVDGWIALIQDGDFPEFVQGRYVGTPQYDQSYFVDIDIDDNIFVYGQTRGDYPVSGNVFSSGDGQFIHKFSPDLITSIISTNFGSTNTGPDISPTAFLVNDCGNIYISGWGGFVNQSTEEYIGGSTFNMPITEDAFQPVTSGSDFYLAVLSDNAEELIYGTYLGGNQSKTHVDGGTSRFDKSGVVYHAVCAGCAFGNTVGGPSSDFPTTSGAWSRTNNSTNCNNASFKFDLSSLKAGIQTNNAQLTKPGLRNFCLGDPVIFENKSVGGETFQWDLGDGRKLDIKEDRNIEHTYDSEGTYRVKLTIIDKSTCSEIDSTFTTVSVTRADIILPVDVVICEGESVTLEAFGGKDYLWRDSVFNEISRSNSIAVSPEESSFYHVEVASAGCIKQDTIHVEVINHPEFTGEVLRTKCEEDPVFEFNAYTEAENFWWDFGNGEIMADSTFQYTYPEDGIFEASFNVQKDKCLFNIFFDVEAIGIRIPSVFTPGIKDGKNDTFKIHGGSEVNLQVNNRWGKPVFEDKAYKNDWSGEEVESGTYYYSAEINNSVYCKGWVYIIKD